MTNIDMLLGNGALMTLFDMFPRIHWTRRNQMRTTGDKLAKLGEEFKEVALARDDAELLNETVDLLHCCVEILREYPFAAIEHAIRLHDAKNSNRGYYEPKDDGR